jgi:hypothetical protein
MKPEGKQNTDFYTWGYNTEFLMSQTSPYSFPILGDLRLIEKVPSTTLNEIWQKFKISQLTFAGHCLEKALIVKEFLRFETDLIMGDLAIEDPLTHSTFFFDFQPPLSFHAWLRDRRGAIIDFSFPGVVYRAMENWRKADEEKGVEHPGACAIQPMILLGSVPIWVKYTPQKGFDVK